MRRSRWAAPPGLLALLALLWTLVGCGGAPAAAQTPGTSGPVMVTSDKASYSSGQAIAVTVHNGLGQAVYAFDTRSGCSILDLQVDQQGQWVTSNAARCPLGRPARMVTIAAGADYTASIAANQFGQTSGPLPTGNYRLALTYLLSPTLPPNSADQLSYSATFTIVGATY